VDLLIAYGVKKCYYAISTGRPAEKNRRRERFGISFELIAAIISIFRRFRPDMGGGRPAWAGRRPKRPGGAPEERAPLKFRFFLAMSV
jgi:hypothetical protein